MLIIEKLIFAKKNRNKKNFVTICGELKINFLS